MRKILLLFVLFTILLFGITFSAPIVNIISPKENEYLTQQIDINFFVQTDNPIIQLGYNTIKESPTISIKNDLNLLNPIICTDTNFTQGTYCIYDLNTLTIPDGNYYFYIFNSGLGHFDWSWSDLVTIDNSPPIIGGFDSNYYNPENGPLLLNLSSVGSDINFESISIKIDANILDTNNYLLLDNFTDSNYDYTDKKLIINTGDLNNGLTYQVDINVSDLAGNFAFADKNIIIDKNKPIINSVSAPEFTNSMTPSIIIDAIDNESGIKDIAFSCNDNNFTTWIVTDNNNPFTYSDFNILNIDYGCSQIDGNRDIYVIVRDLADNNATLGPITIFYDSNAPEMLSLSSSVSQNNVTLTFDATDYNGSGIKGYYVSLDNNNWDFTTSNTYQFISLSNGDYNFYVKATDKADNNSVVLKETKTVNYTPPTPSSGGGGSGGSSWIIPTTPTASGTSQEVEETEEIIEDTTQTITQPIETQEEEFSALEIESTVLNLEEEIDTGPTGLFGLGLVQNSILPLILLLLLALFLIFILKKKKDDENKLYYED